MKNYTGTKHIQATPMSRIQYNRYRGWELPADENGQDDGYLVEYAANKSSKPNQPGHEGYISWSPKDVFEESYFEDEEATTPSGKSLHNTDTNPDHVNVKDIQFWGEATFKLISKASSEAEKWMKSTKALEIEGVGCVVQVTTQQGDNIAEALTFAPNTRIEEKLSNEKVVARRLVGYNN
jgi:hypothetical protein